MKTARILSIGVVVALFMGVQPALADGWSLEKLNAGTTKFFSDTTAGTKKLFSDTATGTKRFFANTTTGTKKLFTGVKDTFSWNKPVPKARQNPFVPWLRQAEAPNKKKSWIDSLFGREEPKQVDSLQDWVGLPRPEF